MWSWGFIGDAVVKNPSADAGDTEMWVQSLGQEEPWSTEWQCAPVFLPEKFHGQRSLAGCCPWSRKELDMCNWALSHTNTQMPREKYVNQLVMSDLLHPHGWQPIRLLCPRNSPDKNTGLFLEILLQGNFPTQGVKLGLLPCRQILYYLHDQGSWPLTSLRFLASEPLGELLSPYVVIYALTYFSSDIMLYILNHS